MKLFFTKKVEKILVGSALILTSILGAEKADAQISTYTFSQSTGTYAPITSGTTVDSAAYGSTANTLDSKNWTISLPFAFEYNSQSYSSLNANSNGYITFGTTTPSTTTTTPISSTTAYEGAISGMGKDLWGVFVSQGTVTTGSNIITGVTDFTGLTVGTTMGNTTGIPTGATVTAFDVVLGTITLSTTATANSTNSSIRWGTGLVKTAVEGTAPNRVFVIEYSGFADYSTTANTRSIINFQIRLSETTNAIDIVYGIVSQNVTTSRTSQVGLRGATSSDYNNRTSTTSWTGTTAGTSNSATVTRTNLINPPSGLTFTWTPSSCLPAGNPTVTSFTSNSATVTWTASTSTPANGYEYYLSTTNTPPTSSTLPTGSVAAGITTLAVNSLSANTNYYLWVRAVCTVNDRSAWSASPANIYTGYCIPSSTLTTTYIDSFSTNGGTTNITKFGTGYTTGGYADYSATDSITTYAGGFFTFRNVFVGGTLGSSIWVDWNNNLIFETSERMFTTSAYTASGSTLLEGSITVPTGTPSGQYRMRVMIHYSSTSPADPCASNSRLEVEDYTLAVGPAPSCLPVIDIASNSILNNSATITWSTPMTAPSNGYYIYYSTSNTLPTATTGPNDSVGAGVTTIALNGLNANTTYYVWVKARCGTTNSEWSAMFESFTTLCNPVSVPFVESFSTGVMPACWLNSNPTYTSTNANAFWKFAGAPGGGTTANGKTAGTYAWVDASAPYTDMHFVTLSTPLLNASSLTNPYVEFEWFKNHTYTNYDNNKLTVQANNGSGWTTVWSDTSNAASWRVVSFSLGASYAVANLQLRFVVDKDVSGNGYFYDDVLLDEVQVSETPSCYAVQVITSNTVTDDSATIVWTAPTPAPANGYYIYYSTSNTPPTATTVPNDSVGAGITSKILTGLSGNTTYYVWLRARCSTGNSDWSSVNTSFTTLCSAYSVPFVESFSNGSLPTCWTNSNPASTSANALWKFSGTPGYGAGANGKPTGTYAWVDASTPNTGLHYVTLTTPILNASTITNPYLEFEWFKNNEDPTPSNNKLTVEANNGSGWAVVWSDTTNAPNWRPIAFSLGASYSVANLQIRFVVDKDLTGNADFYDDLLLDEVKVSETPSCFPPSNLVASNVTGTSASVTWTAPASAPGNGYEYYYSTSSTAPTASTPASGTVTTGTTVSLTGLSNNTTYYVWVRSVCAANDKSSWTVTNFEFTTLQVPATLPYTEPFNSATNWTLVNQNQENQWFIGAATGNPANSLYISNDSGLSNAYTTGTASVSHAFRDITLSSPASSFIFNFDWKMKGEGSTTKYDYFRVWVVPISFFPTAGTQIIAASGGQQIGGTFNDPSATTVVWHNESFQIPTTFAGSTVRLVFEWRNDASGGSQPPAAIDNIFIDACNNTVALGNDTAICTGSTLVLNAGNAGSTYLWSNAATTQSINVTAAGTYHVAVTAANGCVARDTIVVTTNPLPVVNLGNDTAICLGNSLTLNAGNAGSTYLWNNAATTQTINVTTAGTYSVTVTSTANCTAHDTIVVTTSPSPVVNLGNDTTICNGNTLTLNAGNTGATYLWSNAATTQSISVTASGTYWAKVTNASGCFDYDTVIVTVNPVPTIALGNDTSFCAGNAIILDAGNAGMTFLWSNGDTTQTITASTSGTYWAKVTNTSGCFNTDTLVVTVDPSPIANLGNDTAICADDTLHLDAGNVGATYLWSDNSTNQTLQVLDAGTYWVTITNANGCTATDSITIIENPLPSVDSISFTVNASNMYTFTGVNVMNASTYEWSFGDGNTSSSPTATHTYTQAGTYTVTLTVSNDCGSVTVTKTITRTVGVKDISLSNSVLFVYPNPTNHSLTIKNESNYNMEKLEVYNIVGQKMLDVPMMNAKVHTIDVSKFASGMYQMRISMGDAGTVTRKFEVIK